MIVLGIVLIFSVGDGIVAVHGVDGIRERVSWFSWRDKRYLRVKCTRLVAHGDTRTAMLPSSEIGLEFTRISDAFLVDSH